MTEHDQRVLHLARYLRSALEHLDAPPDLVAEVDRLLEQGPQAAVALERLLARHPLTRAWMQEALWSRERHRVKYQPLPGEPESPRAAAYCCPRAGCPMPAYIPFQAGEPVPPCPLHGEALEPCGGGGR